MALSPAAPLARLTALTHLGLGFWSNRRRAHGIEAGWHSALVGALLEGVSALRFLSVHAFDDPQAVAAFASSSAVLAALSALTSLEVTVFWSVSDAEREAIALIRAPRELLALELRGVLSALERVDRGIASASALTTEVSELYKLCAVTCSLGLVIRTSPACVADSIHAPLVFVRVRPTACNHKRALVRRCCVQRCSATPNVHMSAGMDRDCDDGLLPERVVAAVLSQSALRTLAVPFGVPLAPLLSGIGCGQLPALRDVRVTLDSLFDQPGGMVRELRSCLACVTALTRLDVAFLSNTRAIAHATELAACAAELAELQQPAHLKWCVTSDSTANTQPMLCAIGLLTRLTFLYLRLSAPLHILSDVVAVLAPHLRRLCALRKLDIYANYHGVTCASEAAVCALQAALRALPALVSASVPKAAVALSARPCWRVTAHCWSSHNVFTCCEFLVDATTRMQTIKDALAAKGWAMDGTTFRIKRTEYTTFTDETCNDVGFQHGLDFFF
jgi:hypothetical protein